MKFIQEICLDNEMENLKELFYKCNLPQRMPKKNSKEHRTLIEIGMFVYKHCEDLIPERLRNLLKTLDKVNNSKEYINFEKDLLKDVILNVKMKYLYTKTLKESLYIKSNDKEIKRIIEKLNELYSDISSNELYYEEKFNIESRKGYSDTIDKHIKSFFRLTESTKTNSANNKKKKEITHANIPDISSNFLIYTAIMYTRFHKKWGKFSLDKYDDLKKHTDVFKKVVNDCSSNKDIELSLFEKTYNIQLVEDIIRNTQDIDKEDLNKVYKKLSLACLLPNVNSRGKYIEILTKNKRMVVLNEDEHGYGYGFGSSIFNYNIELDAWLETMESIILQMALVTIPMMELYFYYLICQDVEVVGELITSKCIYIREFDASESFDIEDYKYMCKRIEEVYKIYEVNNLNEVVYKMSDSINELHGEIIGFDINLYDLSGNKAIKIIDKYKKFFK